MTRLPSIVTTIVLIKVVGYLRMYSQLVLLVLCHQCWSSKGLLTLKNLSHFSSERLFLFVCFSTSECSIQQGKRNKKQYLQGNIINVSKDYIADWTKLFFHVKFFFHIKFFCTCRIPKLEQDKIRHHQESEVCWHDLLYFFIWELSSDYFATILPVFLFSILLCYVRVTFTSLMWWMRMVKYWML